MRLSALIAVLSLLLAQGCPGPQPAPPETKPPAAEGDTPETEEGGGGATEQAGSTQAPTGNIDDQIVLTYTISSVDTLLGRGVAYVRPHLPPAFSAMLQPAMLKAQWFKALGAPQLEQVVDGTRPLAIAIADPKAHPGGGKLKSMVVALPINDSQGLTDALGQIAERHERTPWNDHVFVFPGGAVRVRIVERYALMAGHEKLLNGAAATLLPLIKSPKTTGKVARLRLDLAAVNRLYGAELDRGLRKIKRKMGRKGPQMAGVGKMVSRWLGYFKSVNDATVELELEPRSIRAVAELVAAPRGEFPGYLGGLRSAAPWGAQFLPRDSAVVFTSNQRPDSMLKSIDESIELLRGLAKGLVKDSALTDIRDLARKSVKFFSGESAGALWVNADGSLGIASVARMKSAAEGRVMMTQLLLAISRELRRILTTGLPPNVKKELKGFMLDLRVRKNGLRVAGARGDLVQLDIRWPRLKNAHARKKLQEARNRLTKVLGRRPTLGIVAVKDVILFAVGKDYRRRLAKMVAIAKGGPGTGMGKVVAGVAGNRRVVALVHVPAASLAEQVMRLLEQVTKVPQRAKDLFQKLLPPPGKKVPVSALVQASGRKMTVELDLSAEFVGMMTRMVLAGMTPHRVGP
jgi:hypothetical protein